jgi:glucokinase
VEPVNDRRDVIIGVDIGGTAMAAGVVTETGEVVLEASAPTHRDGPGSAPVVLDELIRAMCDACARERRTILGIGIGVPGVVDAAAGTIGPEAPHVPELQGQPLAGPVAERFGVPTFIDNDTNAHALAEWRFGEGRGARSLVVLAPGTGFGTGIILEGAVVRGARGFGGELGHSPVKFDGRPCWCGSRGCLAVYASGRGIAEAAQQVSARDQAGAASMVAMAGGDPLRITAPLVFRAAADGDPVAAGIIGEACQALGAGVAIVVNGLNPEVLVITGGVAGSFAALEEEVRGAAAEYCFARALAGTRLVFVPGDKRVTMRGAAALVLYELERRAGLAIGRGAGQTPRP